MKFFSRLVVAAVVLGAGGFGAYHITSASNAPEVVWREMEPLPSSTKPRFAKRPAQQRKAKAEKKARQTAEPWRGSPRGPNESFEEPGRDRLLRIQWVMDQLKIGPGSRVADIGAGGGWFTVRAARRVGPKGVVYAEEILPRFTDYIEKRAKREGLSNIRTILGTTTDPRLPAKTMDAVLILNAYHEFDQPLTMLRKIYASMKPGARLGFIERDDEALRREARTAYAKTGKIKRRVDERPDKDPTTDDHRLAREVVEREAAKVGFKKVSDNELGGDNYLLVVARPE